MSLLLVPAMMIGAASPVVLAEIPTPAAMGAFEASTRGPGSLLGRAYEAASKLPEVPHLKTRGRLQEELVEALLEAGGPVELAREWADSIDNWRRALGVAAVAVHLAKDGQEQAAEAALEAARALEAGLTDSTEQGWRRGRGARPRSTRRREACSRSTRRASSTRS